MFKSADSAEFWRIKQIYIMGDHMRAPKCPCCDYREVIQRGKMLFFYCFTAVTVFAKWACHVWMRLFWVPYPKKPWTWTLHTESVAFFLYSLQKKSVESGKFFQTVMKISSEDEPVAFPSCPPSQPLSMLTWERPNACIHDSVCYRQRKDSNVSCSSKVFLLRPDLWTVLTPTPTKPRYDKNLKCIQKAALLVAY